jgi:dissimilatory sulfite reductase related protein
MDVPSESQSVAPVSTVRIIDDRKILFDGEGFFNDFDDWSESVFLILAEELGLSEITDRHWKVIRYFREFYAYNGRAPLNRQLREGTGMSVMEMEQLFPGGLKLGARRLSGLPNPKTCN